MGAWAVLVTSPQTVHPPVHLGQIDDACSTPGVLENREGGVFRCSGREGILALVRRLPLSGGAVCGGGVSLAVPMSLPPFSGSPL